MIPLYLKGADFAEPADAVYYLLARDGLFLVKRTPVFVSCIRAQGLPWLAGVREEVRWRGPRIPSPLLGRVVGFFREVYQRYQAEAVVLLLCRADRPAFEMEVPEQVVAGGHARYQIGPCPAGLIRVGTLHSHAGAEAFHSDLDDLDERHADGLHVTVGTLDRRPTYACSLMVDGRRFPLTPLEVFEAIPADGGDPADPAWLARLRVEEVPRDIHEDGPPAAI